MRNFTALDEVVEEESDEVELIDDEDDAAADGADAAITGSGAADGAAVVCADIRSIKCCGLLFSWCSRLSRCCEL